MSGEERTIMAIRLTDVLTITDPTQFKLHLATRNEDWVNPLDEYVADRQNWVGWNESRGRRNDWTRPFIFSLMQFYPQKNRYLFGGVFKILARDVEKYSLESVTDYEKYEGRLLVTFARYQGMMGRAFNLESYIDQFEVSEIFPMRYSGEAFCGYSNIEHDFGLLESIFKNERHDWKVALSAIKGIYVIFDKSNGRKYVGSAYGEAGIWARWACYIGTGHGSGLFNAVVLPSLSPPCNT